jgi:hypothetical protein
MIQNESPYNVSARQGSRVPSVVPSISDKVNIFSHYEPHPASEHPAPAGLLTANIEAEIVFHSSPFHQIPQPGAQTFLPTTMRAMMIYTIPTLDATETVIMVAVLSLLEASPMLVVLPYSVLACLGFCTLHICYSLHWI